MLEAAIDKGFEDAENSGLLSGKMETRMLSDVINDVCATRK